jgi:hypothetical protein
LRKPNFFLPSDIFYSNTHVETHLLVGYPPDPDRYSARRFVHGVLTKVRGSISVVEAVGYPQIFSGDLFV